MGEVGLFHWYLQAIREDGNRFLSLGSCNAWYSYAGLCSRLGKWERNFVGVGTIHDFISLVIFMLLWTRYWIWRRRSFSWRGFTCGEGLQEVTFSLIHGGHWRCCRYVKRMGFWARKCVIKRKKVSEVFFLSKRAGALPDLAIFTLSGVNLVT